VERGLDARRRIGLNVPFRGESLAALRDRLVRVEALGFSDLWSQESDTCDAFTPLGVAAAWTRRARLGTAIASVFTRGPALLAMQAASMADAAPGRFVLGLGTSSATIVEGWNGLHFERPFSRMRDTLRWLRALFERGRADAEGAAIGVRGFRLGVAIESPPPIHVAALGPRMLELAAREADGVLLSLVGPDHAMEVVRRYRELEPAGRRGEVVLRFGCLLDPDRERAITHARRTLAAYLSVPTYAALYASLGEGERVAAIREAWDAGARAEARSLVPDAWVEGAFAIGDAEEINAAVGRFREAGIDLPIVSPLVFDGDLDEALELWANARGEG
jgi:probable F420-dependent oxidoreductase